MGFAVLGSATIVLNVPRLRRWREAERRAGAALRGRVADARWRASTTITLALSPTEETLWSEIGREAAVESFVLETSAGRVMVRAETFGRVEVDGGIDEVRRTGSRAELVRAVDSSSDIVLHGGRAVRMAETYRGSAAATYVGTAGSTLEIASSDVAASYRRRATVRTILGVLAGAAPVASFVCGLHVLTIFLGATGLFLSMLTYQPFGPRPEAASAKVAYGLLPGVSRRPAPLGLRRRSPDADDDATK